MDNKEKYKELYDAIMDGDNIKDILSMMSNYGVDISDIDTPEKYIDAFTKVYYDNKMFKQSFHKNISGIEKEYHNFVGAIIGAATSLGSSILPGLLGGGDSEEDAQSDAIQAQAQAQEAGYLFNYLTNRAIIGGKTEGKKLEGQTLIYFLIGIAFLVLIGGGLFMIIKSSKKRKGGVNV